MRFSRCALAFGLLALGAAGCMSPDPASRIVTLSAEKGVAPEIVQQQWQSMWAEGAWPKPKNAADVNP